MEALFKDLLTNGGPAGIAVVIAVLSIGWIARHNGWLISSSKRADTALAAGGSVEQQLTLLEAEVKRLPTREELHKMQLDYAKMSERMEGIASTAATTQSAVLRIESFMIEASQRSK